MAHFCSIAASEASDITELEIMICICRSSSVTLRCQKEILAQSCRKHKVSGLKCLGGFRNERSDYHWEGFKLELDKTMFPHGTVYEVEVETVSLNSNQAKNLDLAFT